MDINDKAWDGRIRQLVQLIIRNLEFPDSRN